MNIVKFKNGTYGIRKGNWLIGYKYKSINMNTWWSLGQNAEACYQGSKERVEENFFAITDKGVVIK